jgi:hypothetical protein
MSEQDDKVLDAAVDAANLVGLPAEALTPAKVPTLEERMAAAPKTDAPVTTPRKRGRPPGSKNKATLQREAEGKATTTREPSGARMVTPPPKPPKPDDGLTPQQRHEHKLQRAAELSEKVADAINDNILLVLMSMGMEPDLLYMPGMAPQQVQVNNKYTPLARMLTIQPMQANTIGRFLAELEETETGGKVTGAVSDGKGPLILYGILSLASVVQYGKNLKDAYEKFEPLLTAYRAQQVDNQTTGGSENNA